MTTRITVTDTALETMLARRAHRSDPIGLADAVFAALEVTPPRRGQRLAWPAAWLPGRASRELTWVLVAATLLLALVTSVLVGGGLLRERRLTNLVPTGIVFEHLENLLAVSADEAWAADDRGIWHFLDGAWTGPQQPASLAGAQTRALALAADGTLWVATDNGVAALHAGRWTTAWERAAWSIAVAPDGTAWAGDPSREIVGLRLDGAPPRTVTCPNGSMVIAVTTDGSVFVGQFSYSGMPGLARFDGQACERVDPPGDGLGVEVVDIDADSSSGLVAYWFRSTPDDSTWTGYLARFDGTGWTLIEKQGRGGFRNFTVAPSGEVWRAGADPDGGIERYDGERWITVATGFQVVAPISVAPDGTVWFAGPSGIERLGQDALRP